MPNPAAHLIDYATMSYNEVGAIQKKTLDDGDDTPEPTELTQLYRIRLIGGAEYLTASPKKQSLAWSMGLSVYPCTFAQSKLQLTEPA